MIGHVFTPRAGALDRCASHVQPHGDFCEAGAEDHPTTHQLLRAGFLASQAECPTCEPPTTIDAVRHLVAQLDESGKPFQLHAWPDTGVQVLVYDPARLDVHVEWWVL